MRWKANRCPSMATARMCAIGYTSTTTPTRCSTVATRGSVGQTYNIGANNEQANLDVVQRICAILDELRPDPLGPHARLITFVTDRPGHDARYAIDATKINTELGWAPKESFDSGLRRTVEWYLANPSWWRDIRSGIYRGQRLGVGAAAETVA